MIDPVLAPPLVNESVIESDNRGDLISARVAPSATMGFPLGSTSIAARSSDTSQEPLSIPLAGMISDLICALKSIDPKRVNAADASFVPFIQSTNESASAPGILICISLA